MAHLYRSETMSYVRLLMTDDNVQETIKEIGKWGKMHFVDLASSTPTDAFQYYKRRVATCQYWERKLESFREAFGQYKVDVPNPVDIEARDIHHGDVLEAIRSYLEPLEEAFTKNVVFRRHHAQLINEHLEWLTVLNHAANINAPVDLPSESQSYRQIEEEKHTFLESGLSGRNNFSTSISGVIAVEKQALFERMLFRVSRGNIVTHFYPMDQPLTDPATGESILKTVFTLRFMGEQLRNRIGKIVQHLGASEYTVPQSSREIGIMYRDMQQRVNEYTQVLNRTDEEIRTLLDSMAWERSALRPNESAIHSPWIDWTNAMRIERMMCDTLRKCDTGGNGRSKMVTAEGWIPETEIEGLRSTLHQAVRTSQAKQAALQIMHNPSSPPTYFRLNSFTASFQGIVDTYGVPRYKEVNPGLFTIITFPFLFGIMYGDIGHGTLLTAFALFLILNETKFIRQIKRGEMGEIFKMAFGGRYIMVMMGAFAIYCGTIYNDCFSIPLNLYGSRWDFYEISWQNTTVVDGNLVTKNFTDTFANMSSPHPYPYGFDPNWYHTTNELAFFNSFKMKLSVTLGVIQMTFGIFLGLFNHLYHKDYLHIFFEFLPRLVFMMSTFGYMIFIILYKLCCDWSAPGSNPPNLIQTMISMFLSPGHVEEEHRLYQGQEVVQGLLLLAAFVSVPLMLFPVPCITKFRLQRKSSPSHQVDDNGIRLTELNEPLLSDDDSEEHKESTPSSPLVVDESSDSHGGHHGDGPYSFSDHMITQGIHTIEFVLGCVSNTASYLRLWALSLAHAELAAVFWNKMIRQYGLEADNVIQTFASFAIWAVATFAVLCCMDTLECFLHALRLHWVEFQNKFFAADGYAFDPFSFDEKDEE